MERDKTLAIAHPIVNRIEFSREGDAPKHEGHTCFYLGFPERITWSLPHEPLPSPPLPTCRERKAWGGKREMEPSFLRRRIFKRFGVASTPKWRKPRWYEERAVAELQR